MAVRQVHDGVIDKESSTSGLGLEEVVNLGTGREERRRGEDRPALPPCSLRTHRGPVASLPCKEKLDQWQETEKENEEETEKENEEEREEETEEETEEEEDCTRLFRSLQPVVKKPSPPPGFPASNPRANEHCTH